MSKPYQGNEPTYRVDKEKGKYVIRKFVRFDHSWAEYSPPIATYESEAEAEGEELYLDNDGDIAKSLTPVRNGITGEHL